MARGDADANGLTGQGELRLHQLEQLEWMAKWLKEKEAVTTA